MFHVFQLARSQRRQIIDRLEVAIRLVEDHVAWAEAYSARLAAAGRTEDATYARASLELGRLHLVLLCRGRGRLLLREWPREGGRAALKACLLNALRDWRGGEPYRVSLDARPMRTIGGDLGRRSSAGSGLT
jgi:hypothetical protein